MMYLVDSYLLLDLNLNSNLMVDKVHCSLLSVTYIE